MSPISLAKRYWLLWVYIALMLTGLFVLQATGWHL